MTVYKKSEAVQLTKNFSSKEFKCKCKNSDCTTTTINSNLPKQLQKIRNHFNKPVVINSGYRCAKHNKAVGGATYSKHRLGQAADIVVKGVPALEVARYCETIGIKGIGLYETFVHVDTRTKKSFWYSSKQYYRSTFLEKKTLRQVAEDVIDGVYGTGAARKKKLEAAGYNYSEVQALVNELLRK